MIVSSWMPPAWLTTVPPSGATCAQSTSGVLSVWPSCPRMNTSTSPAPG